MVRGPSNVAWTVVFVSFVACLLQIGRWRWMLAR
jgi:hypothetical protein